MADVPISGLPAAASANAADQHPVNQAGTTRRLTNQQIFNLSLTLLNGTNPLFLGSSNIQIDGLGNITTANTAVNSDGSASFAGGDIQFASNGVASFGDAVNIVNADLELFNPNQGVIQHSRPGNIRYRIVIDDAGNLGTEAA